MITYEDKGLKGIPVYLGKFPDGRLQFGGGLPLALFPPKMANRLPRHGVRCPYESGECLARYQQAWKLPDEIFEQLGNVCYVIRNVKLLWG